MNPLRERGLERFTSPQHPAEMLTNTATPIAQTYYQVKIGGDLALLKGMMKWLLDADADEHTPAPSYETEGTVDAIDAEAGSLTLTHGEIPALQWPAMTMDFLIADPGLVKDIAPGTPVRFVFKAGEPGEYIVTGIEPLAGVATPEGTGGTGADGAGADGAAGSTAPGARDDHRGH